VMASNPAEDNPQLYDCWSDDGGGLSCRPCVGCRTQFYCCDSDSSLHSCNSCDALRQFTATTSPFCPRTSTHSARCWTAKTARKQQQRSRSADGDGRNACWDLLDANDANDCCSSCTYVVERLHDPANVQQTSSKCIQNTRANCWTFAISCKHPISLQIYRHPHQWRRARRQKEGVWGHCKFLAVGKLSEIFLRKIMV